jgi:thiopurine S-methyltransferase
MNETNQLIFKLKNLSSALNFDKNYWERRWAEGQTGWDTRSATEPIKHYFDQIADKQAKILIPGCGNAHEAIYLFESGFKNVYICDWAEQPLMAFSERIPDFPKAQLLCADFFDLKTGDFDFIVEQTFFCALAPELRNAYAHKVRSMLRKGGKLVGLLFNFPLTEAGPPFGGSTEEYLHYFEPLFESVYIEPCYNSIKPRLGSELFILIS